LGEGLLRAFPELDATSRNADTVLTGPLTDQAALHGVLVRIEELGLELVEVRRHDVSGRPARRTTAPAARTGRPRR
jgi:hypothetical protein